MELALQQEKAALRRRLRAALKAMDAEERRTESERAVEMLEAHPHFRSAQTLVLFHSLPDEVFTHTLVEKLAAEGRRVLLPVCQGDNMLLRRYDSREDLRTGAFRIEEPQGEAFEDYGAIDLVVVPGVAFDKAGHRMGRGRGYYDRFFAHPDLQHVYKIGLCYPSQLVESVPTEPHDRPVDRVVCG